MKPLAPNTLLQNRYLIVQLIGKGGMGEVYLAVDQRLGSAIAIKRTYFSEDDMLGDAFEREARTLARLRHPVLPKVSDHFVENENQYLVMEHISGDDLAKRLESNKKPFPVNWVLYWADQLLDALNYLHSHEPPIIHRDIKPQNLKLTDDNQIVLLDFGLAKDTVGQTKITTTGSVVGYTPHYAPMEQIRGTGTNPRSDIYSLSATLYQLLTNTVPFDALTRADSLLNGVPDPVKPIHEINREVPKVISDIILKGMSVSQEQRYATAREMQKTLRDAYSTIQSAMAAQTVAFNLQESTAEEQSPAVDDKNFATIVNEPPPFQERYDSNPTPTAAETEVLNQADIFPDEPAADYDATVRIDNMPEFEPQTKQADIKTEVFLAEELSVADEYKRPADIQSEAENKPVGDATVPLISFDDQPKSEPVQNFDSPATDFSADEPIPVSGEDVFITSEENIGEQPDFLKTEYVSAGQDAVRNEEYTAAVPPERQQPATPVNYENAGQMPPEQQQKKSGGKGLIIGIGLFALLILFAGAGFGGWYVYQNFIAVETPPPTPEASPSVELTPEITPEPTLAETNTDTSDTDIVDEPGNTGETNSVETNATETNTEQQQDTRVVTPPTPKQTQTVRPTPRQTPAVTVNTPRPTPPPKRTPVPQKTPGSRTDLIKP
mgnify:CR=1 FL=1|jgi:serine/threonine protein kinase